MDSSGISYFPLPGGVYTAPNGGFYPPSFPALSGATVKDPVPEFPGTWDYYVVCGHLYFPKCHKCAKYLQNEPYITVTHTQCHRLYCLKCATYTAPHGFGQSGA